MMRVIRGPVIRGRVRGNSEAVGFAQISQPAQARHREQPSAIFLARERQRFDAAGMLHDGALARNHDAPETDERRGSPRQSQPAEVVVRWHHEPQGAVRYEVIDRSEGGVRIRSSMPMLTGMTAHLLRLLPEGNPLNQAAQVVWCRVAPDGYGYHLGLSFLETA